MNLRNLSVKPTQRWPIYSLLFLSGLLAGCGTASPTATLPAPAGAAQPTVQAAPTLTSGDSTGAYLGPAWAEIPLVDSHTGNTFTLASLAGKTVFVEPMATWCTNCRRQIPNVEAARKQLDPDKFVFVGLSVAENVDNTTLANYVDGQGWHFLFAVAPESLTQGLVDTFGRTAVTPPSTPHFIIKPDGTLTDMVTGTHTAEQLLAEINALGG